VSLPAFRGENGLPVGLQLIGGFRCDSALLAAAEAVQQALEIGSVRAPG
jgi:Asp-tRNA(Asn)/Glu-tRNA(Gln) amidotransferase A subunit family amidase